jgi:hypothetical protein
MINVFFQTVLYVERSGAVLPQRFCLRFVALSHQQRGGYVKQIVEHPVRFETLSTGLMLFYREYIIFPKKRKKFFGCRHASCGLRFRLKGRNDE